MIAPAWPAGGISSTIGPSVVFRNGIRQTASGFGVNVWFRPSSSRDQYTTSLGAHRTRRLAAASANSRLLTAGSQVSASSTLRCVVEAPDVLRRIGFSAAG